MDRRGHDVLQHGWMRPEGEALEHHADPRQMGRLLASRGRTGGRPRQGRRSAGNKCGRETGGVLRLQAPGDRPDDEGERGYDSEVLRGTQRDLARENGGPRRAAGLTRQPSLACAAAATASSGSGISAGASKGGPPCKSVAAGRSTRTRRSAVCVHMGRAAVRRSNEVRVTGEGRHSLMSEAFHRQPADIGSNKLQRRPPEYRCSPRRA